MKKRCRIVVADDHEIDRLGLHTLLKDHPGCKIVGEAGDGVTALRLVRKHRPNIIICDVTVTCFESVSFLRAAKEVQSSASIIVLTEIDDEVSIGRAFDEGADAYVLKRASSGDILAAIEAVRKGNRFLGPLVSRKVIDSFVKHFDGGKPLGAGKAPWPILSKREHEILKYVSKGMTNRQIADSLFISPSTVHNHRINLMRKLNVHKVADLVRIALQDDLLADSPSE